MAIEERYYAKPGPMAPLALVDEWLGVWIQGQWQCYKVLHYEPIPRSRAFTFDFGAVAAGAWAAATPISAAVVLAQRQTPPEAMQIRFYPLDDIEVLFSIGNASVRFKTLNVTARADIFTMQVDPDLHSTEVVILANNSPFINVFNPTGRALGQSRVVFPGIRYLLDTQSQRTFNTGAEARKALGPVTLASSGGF
jgi:hypothetical protein